MKKVHSFIIICLISIVLIGCSKTNAALEQSKEDMSVLNSGNLHDINMLIWGADSVSNNSSTSSIETSDTETNSIIETIAKKANVEIVSVQNDKATLRVTAPNLESFFEDATNAASEIEDDVLLEKYMIDYINHAELITKEVEINMVEKDGIMRIDYTDPVFINTFTGGLVDGYTSVRNSLLAQ